MKHVLTVCGFALLIALVTGCGRRPTRSEEEMLNTPLTLTEAKALMESVDQKGAELAWPPEVLRSVRRSMKGRLLAADTPEEDINAWISSPPPQRNTTKPTADI